MQRWDPDAETVNPRRCRNCGDHVSAEFRRTHGDSDGHVWSCPGCATYGQLTSGDAAIATDGGRER